MLISAAMVDAQPLLLHLLKKHADTFRIEESKWLSIGGKSRPAAPREATYRQRQQEEVESASAESSPSLLFQWGCRESPRTWRGVRERRHKRALLWMGELD